MIRTTLCDVVGIELPIVQREPAAEIVRELAAEAARALERVKSAP